MINALWDEVGCMRLVLRKVGLWDSVGCDESGMLVDAAANIAHGVQPVIGEIAAKAREEGATQTGAALTDLSDMIEQNHLPMPLSFMLDNIGLLACEEGAPHAEAWLNGLTEDIEQEELEMYSAEASRLLGIIRERLDDPQTSQEVKSELATVFSS